jgi:hypothetical protein
VSHNKIGDVQIAQGDLIGALISYRGGLAIIDPLAQSDPGNAGWQRDLSVSYEKIGKVQVAQGDLAGALTSYRDSLAIKEMGNRADASQSLRQSHAIVVRMTALSPDNVQWKQDLDWLASRIAELSQ